MSLTTMIDSKEHRELFKAIAPPKSMFRSLTQDPPFAKAEPRTPGRFHLPESALIGMAFNYLLRAQVARWTGDSWERTVPWVATHGLECVLTTAFGEEGSPMMLPYGEGLTEELGQLEKDAIEDQLHVGEGFTAEEIEIRHRLCEHYGHAYDRWVHFISGGSILAHQMIADVWFLAKLEDIYRAGGVLSELHNRPRMDPAGTLVEPPNEVVGDIEALWRLLEGHRAFFSSSETVSYNPTFGEASMMVGGADGDLLVGTTLVDIKTTVKWGYRWADAAQLVGYYVFAAMVGVPWPIDRLAIYRSRFGRIEYVDCEEVRQSIDLLDFAEQLIDKIASSLSESLKRQKNGFGMRVASDAVAAHEQRRATLLGNAQRNLA